MNGEIEPLIFTLDDTSVREGAKRANASIDGLRNNVVRSGGVMESAWERQMRSMEKMSRSVESYGGSSERFLKGMAAGVRGAGEFAAAVILSTKAIGAEIAAHSALEASLNRVRVARVAAAGFVEGLGGAFTVATEVGAIVAIERVAQSTFERAKQIQTQALAAQRSGVSYEDRAALDFTAQRFGKTPDYFDSAVKSAGGVDQLAKKLRELQDIGDPLARAEVAFKTFGPESQKVLDTLGERFGDNIQRAQGWGFALDEVSRTKIEGFNRDVKDLRNSLDGLGDSLAATKQGFISVLQVDFAGIWSTLIGGTGDIIGRIRTAIGNVTDDPNAHFKEITKGAQSSITGRASADALSDAQKDIFRNLGAPAERRFQKDQNSIDNEASLRADIADLQKKLFVSDRTSANYGKLVTGASYPGGPGQEALAVQKYTSDQNQLARVLEHKKELKDADEAARKAAQELEAAQRTVASGLQSAQIAELTGMDRLRKERDIQLVQYGKTRDLVRDIGREFDIRFGIEGKAIAAESAKDMRARAAVEARSQEGQLNARSKYTGDVALSTIRLSGEAPSKRQDVALQGADLQRESQLRQLEGVEAKTLQQKVAVEASKFQIESTYFRRIRDLESEGIDRGYQKELSSLRVLVNSKLITEQAFDSQKRALEQNESLDLIKLHERADAEIEKSGIAAARAIREEYTRQLDGIKQESAGLWNTLFTHPGDFGRQFGETVRAAFLKPIVDGLSEMTAKALHPLIYGAGGQGGLAGTLKGAFGGKSQDPIKLSTDMLKGSTDINSNATDRNTDALRSLTQAWERRGQQPAGNVSAVPQGGGGFLGGFPSFGSFARSAGLGLAGFAGLGGLAAAAPSIPVPAAVGGADATIRYATGDSQSFPSEAFGSNPASILGPGGTAGFAPGDVGGGGYGGAQPGGPSGGIPGSLRGIFGVGQSQGGQQGGIGGIGGMLGNFKNINWGGITRAPNVMTNAGQTVGSAGSHITGVSGVAGAGLMAGGSLLAQQGLLGSQRGTWGGIAMGTAGGAAIGFALGGPIGAGIGAAVGFGIGLGEKIAGVESPESHAKKLVKDLYKINIDTNMARSIVQIADQKYGKAISVAVRSPEVRQMLELFSAGTGQKMPMSATTPHSAILSEQRGQLFQEQSYRFGQGYTHQSSLPVAGGGNPGVYPTMGSIRLDGPATTALLRGEVAQVATPSYIQDRFSQAQRSSDGRLVNAAMTQVPGLIFG